MLQTPNYERMGLLSLNWREGGRTLGECLGGGGTTIIASWRGRGLGEAVRRQRRQWGGSEKAAR